MSFYSKNWAMISMNREWLKVTNRSIKTVKLLKDDLLLYFLYNSNELSCDMELKVYKMEYELIQFFFTNFYKPI